jgi:hypothetical protein
LYKDKSIHISEFAGYFSLFMKNANIPLLASHRPSPRFPGEPLEELISLRSREVQLTKFVFGDFERALNLDQNYFMRNFAQIQTVENFKDADGILGEYRKTIVELESFQVKHENYLAKKDLILMLILCVPGLAIWLSIIWKIFITNRGRCFKKPKTLEERISVKILVGLTALFWMVIMPVWFPFEEDVSMVYVVLGILVLFVGLRIVFLDAGTRGHIIDLCWSRFVPITQNFLRNFDLFLSILILSLTLIMTNVL